MIFRKVVQIVSDQLRIEPDRVREETDLINDLEADSLDAVEIIMAIEEEYNIEIPDDVVEKINTVGDIVDYLGDRING